MATMKGEWMKLGTLADKIVDYYTALLYQEITNMHTHRAKVIDFHISSIFSCVNSLRKTSLHAGTSPIAIL